MMTPDQCSQPGSVRARGCGWVSRLSPSLIILSACSTTINGHRSSESSLLLLPKKTVLLALHNLTRQQQKWLKKREKMNNGEGVTSAPGPGRQGPRGIDAAFLFSFLLWCFDSADIFLRPLLFLSLEPYPRQLKARWHLGYTMPRTRAAASNAIKPRTSCSCAFTTSGASCRCLGFFPPRTERTQFSSILARERKEKRNLPVYHLIKQRHLVANLATLTSGPSPCRDPTRAGAVHPPRRTSTRSRGKKTRRPHQNGQPSRHSKRRPLLPVFPLRSPAPLCSPGFRPPSEMVSPPPLHVPRAPVFPDRRPVRRSRG
jgi:hypothetical protein